VAGRSIVHIREEGGPVFAQLRDGIRRRIERGSLLPGDTVPTVRACAEHLDLAPNTVARAYRELEAEGWLVGRGRKGTFVADRLPERPSDAEAALATAADAYVRRAAQLGFSRKDAIRAIEGRIARR
jgi:DNA-binding transcriptional regulator YhcF (GntR family)